MWIGQEVQEVLQARRAGGMVTTLCGQYVKEVADASHILFDGCLDDPNFCRISMQKIEDWDGETMLTLSESGKLRLMFHRGEWKVRISYTGFLGTKHRTSGHLFKDQNTPSIGERRKADAAESDEGD
jgi:hypothetical protein